MRRLLYFHFNILDVDEENEASFSRGEKEKKSKDTRDEQAHKERRMKDSPSQMSTSIINGVKSSSFFAGKTFLFYGPFELNERQNLLRYTQLLNDQLVYFFSTCCHDAES